MKTKSVAIVFQPPNLSSGMTCSVVGRFDTIEEATEYLNETISQKDPAGVFNGLYGIDAPEKMMSEWAKEKNGNRSK
jgi:hypothetical protein